MLENWYPIFKNHTFETKFVSLPSEFVNYLLEDGIFVDSEVFPTPEKEYRYDMGEEWSDEEEVLFISSQQTANRTTSKIPRVGGKDERDYQFFWWRSLSQTELEIPQRCDVDD